MEWLCAKLYRKLIPTAPRHVPRCPAPTLLLLPHDTVFGVETLQPTARRLKCLSLCSAALWRRFQEEADRRPGHNAELLARDSSAKISGKPNLQQKRFPLPINAYTCPALPTFQAVLIFQERFWQLAWSSWASCRSAQDLSLCPENMFF